MVLPSLVKNEIGRADRTEEPQSEPEEEPIEEEVAIEEEPPQTNWEKRYMILKSHSKK